MSRVIVVGSVNVDLVVAGERLPAAGETVVGGSFSRHHGGKGGNQAVASARIGAPTVLVAAIGADDFGADARTALARERIAQEFVVTLDDVPTGVALILVDQHGENQIAVAPGANAELAPEHVRAAFTRLGLRPGDVVLATHEIPTATVREALALGRAAGSTTILNPAPVGGLDRSILALADLLTPNRGELARLVAIGDRRTGRRGGGDDGTAGAAALLGAGPDGPGVGRAILVTLGSAGAMLVTATGTLDLVGPPVEAVDATGAGDALNGVLAAGLAAGLELEDAARRAIAAASLSVTVAGAREGMPSRDQLDAFIAGRT